MPILTKGIRVFFTICAFAFLFLSVVPRLGDVQASSYKLTYTIDRSSVPWLTYNDLTLKINLGPVAVSSVTANGNDISYYYNATTGDIVITTSATDIEMVISGDINAQTLGLDFSKSILKDDKKWAWSHSFDDNSMYSARGIPIFDTYGWRSTVYMIGNAISNTRDENWIVDRAELVRRLQKGWGIGNHTWDHDSVSGLGGTTNAKANITKLETYFRQMADSVGRQNYRLMSFAAPLFDSAYEPLILVMRNKNETEILFNESGNDWALRMDPGAAEPQYGLATVFSFDTPIGRDWRIQEYGKNSTDGANFATDIQTITNSLDETHHYWLNTFNHGVDEDPSGTGIFGFIPWLYSTYGPDGNNTVWVAPAEEIYSYALVRSKAVVTFNGISPVGSDTPTSTISQKPGDANGDGKVDGVDYIAWLVHYNQSTSSGFSVGDFNNDGKVDGVDYIVWLTNYA